MIESVGTPWLWGGFLAFVAAMLALDLGVFHRRPHEVHVGEALAWSGAWIALALVFNAWIYWRFGAEIGLEFLTGYLIEKSLSVDNVFVFVLLFTSFAVPKNLQHRVLFWGIFGALIMRIVFILFGALLLQRFHWVIYLFGGILIYSGYRFLVHGSGDVHPENNPLYRLFTRVAPAVPDYHGGAFTVLKDGRRHATPLLLVLVAIEASDLVFAVDSIPAIFGITEDPFIVFTSNIFAILGLRALYFVLGGFLGKFRYLDKGLALVLLFVGGKMLLAGVVHVSTPLSLLVVAGVIGGSVVLSLLRPAKGE